MLVVLHTRIPRTPEELVVDVFEEDLNFLQNLHEADKMELLSDVTFYNYWVASLFSLVTSSQSYILAMGNPSKDRYTWKEKCEAIKVRCSKFQKKVSFLQEKMYCVEIF
ncbi:unnamed protein product [Vicia faba]|uniref:Uncharacterized protein n=1 Tax=Vicia faba TaxID=3906 RepID=A0AAV0YFQ1_VICFA|nr:unnamed protein product [Vicia faba]